MSLQRAYSLLGFCARAGKCRSGAGCCEAMVRAQKCCLLLISERMSAGGREKLEAACRQTATPFLSVADSDGQLGNSIGKPGVLTVGIGDKEFAKTLEKALIQT